MIAKMFLSSKKLPAMTNKKYGDTMRISFSRRIDKEGTSLFIVSFS
jgi:hypothetical protein